MEGERPAAPAAPAALSPSTLRPSTAASRLAANREIGVPGPGIGAPGAARRGFPGLGRANPSRRPAASHHRHAGSVQSGGRKFRPGFPLKVPTRDNQVSRIYFSDASSVDKTEVHALHWTIGRLEYQRHVAADAFLSEACDR